MLPTSFDLLWSLTARRRRGDDPHAAADPLDLADRADPSLHHVAQAIARTFAAGRCLNAITVFCTVGTNSVFQNPLRGLAGPDSAGLGTVRLPLEVVALRRSAAGGLG